MENNSCESDVVFGNDFERRVWVAAFEAECAKEKCSQLAAFNADARLSLFRRMDPMVYANERAIECDAPVSEPSIESGHDDGLHARIRSAAIKIAKRADCETEAQTLGVIEAAAELCATLQADSAFMTAMSKHGIVAFLGRCEEPTKHA